MSATPFAAAAPVTQARRLARAARRALDEWGVPCDRLRLLHHVHNTTFRIDRRGRPPLALRVYRAQWRTRPAIEGELTWLRALGETTEIGAPVPVRPPADVVDGDLDDTRTLALFTWVGGENVRRPGAQVQPTHARLMGRLVADLHGHALSWTPPPGFERPVGRGPGIDGGIGPTPRLAPAEADLVARATDAVLPAFDRLDAAGCPTTVVHNDIHLGNVRFAGGRARPIDFDDSCIRHHAFDLAIAVDFMTAVDTGGVLVDALLDGYREQRPLPPGFEADLPTLLLARKVEIVLWLTQFRDDAVIGGPGMEGWLRWLLDGIGRHPLVTG